MTSKKPPGLPEEKALEAAGFGSVEDWAPFVGVEEATQLLTGLGALGGSQELLDQITSAVMPGAAQGGEPLGAEEQLRRAELRFRSLVENLPCVAFVASMSHARNEVYINRYIEQLLGYTREEWLRDPFLWYWRVHPDDRAAWNEEFARGLVTGGPWQAECRFLAADGHAVWLRGHAQIVRDADGRPLFLQGIAFDISVIREAEQRARSGRDEALAAIDALPEGLVVVAAGGAVTHVNAAAGALLGLAGTPPSTLDALAHALALDPPQRLIEHIEGCRSAGTPATMLSEIAGPPPRRLEIQCLPPPTAAQGPGPVVLRIVPAPAAPPAVRARPGSRGRGPKRR